MLKTQSNKSETRPVIFEVSSRTYALNPKTETLNSKLVGLGSELPA